MRLLLTPALVAGALALPLIAATQAPAAASPSS